MTIEQIIDNLFLQVVEVSFRRQPNHNSQRKIKTSLKKIIMDSISLSKKTKRQRWASIHKNSNHYTESRYSNPELDALLDSGSKEPDAAKRTATYKEVQEILAQDMPVVNLFELEFLTVYNTQLKGADGSAMGAYGSFREAWLDD